MHKTALLLIVVFLVRTIIPVVGVLQPNNVSLDLKMDHQMIIHSALVLLGNMEREDVQNVKA